MIQRLAQRHSRRSLVGGSFGASVLAALGLGEEVLARKDGVSAEACIPSGKKCPAKKPRGKKAKKLGCKQCCQRFSIGGRKGNRKCSCKPVGQPCTADRASDCCTGICDGSFCANAPNPPGAPQCTPFGTRCTGFAPACCSGVCNARGSDIDGTADECAPCLTGGARCVRNPDSCCDGRTCTASSTGGANPDSRCCSVANETCDATAIGACCGARTCTNAGNTDCCGAPGDPCTAGATAGQAGACCGTACDAGPTCP
jgi:hypothetical protein